MRPIKHWTVERVGRDIVFAKVMLGEPDEISAVEFLDRLPVYMRILRSESSRSV